MNIGIMGIGLMGRAFVERFIACGEVNGFDICVYNRSADKLAGLENSPVEICKTPGELIERFAVASPYRSQRSFGSVALDWCWLAAERVQVYLHGGQKLWDYAAGSLVLSEAGGSGGLFENYAGTRVQELTLQPRIAIAATSADLFDQWNAWLEHGMAGHGRA